ncbi:hypothetical protein HanIR_Chr08g0342661 [Helianthus annuus]|nr:hypothetical protein HanIR_Chr08g0342661 [Helianthus annuus]
MAFFVVSEEIVASNERICLKTGSTFKIPVVRDDLTPKSGMIFGSLGYCYSLYLKYVTAAGFGVKKGTEKINDKGEKHLKYYMCTRARHYKNKKLIHWTLIRKKKECAV